MATDQNKAIFELEVRLQDLDDAIDKADEVEKQFLETQKEILRGAKASHLKQQRALDKQLKDGLISRRKHSKSVIALQKNLADKMVQIRKESSSAKVFIQEGKKAEAAIKASSIKQTKAIEAQLKKRVIDKKQAAKAIIQIERRTQKEIIKLNKITKKSLDVIRKSTVDSFKKADVKAKSFFGKLKKGFGKAEGQAGSFSKKLIGGLAIAGVGVAIKGLFNLGAASIDATNKMEALQQRAETVFGDSLPLVAAAAEETAAKIGLTTLEFQSAAAAIGDLLIPLGSTRQEAAEMSIEMVKTAAALQQFTGDSRDAAEISRILQAAVLGEFEQLKTLGIKIGEIDVKTELLARGQQNLTGDTLQLAKAQVIQELITRKSSDALEAYSNNAEKGQILTNRLSAAYKTLGESGNKILSSFFAPFQTVILGVVNLLNKSIQKLREFFNIANAQTKADQNAILSLRKTRKELEKISKIKDKSLNQQIKENQIRAKLNKQLKEAGILTTSLASTNKELIEATGQALAKSITTSASRIKSLDSLIKKREATALNAIKRLNKARNQSDSAQKFAEISRTRRLIRGSQASILRLKREQALLIQNLKLAAGVEREQRKFKKVKAPRIRRRTKAESDFDKSQIEVEDTSLEQLDKEQTFLDDRIKMLQGNADKELELKAATLARKDSLDQEAVQKEFETINVLEEKRQKLQTQFNETTSKKEKARIKEKLKVNAKSLKQEQKMEAILAKNKAKIRQRSAAIAEKIHSNSVDVAEALFSREKGAFRRLIASKIKDFAIWLSKKLALQSAAFFASGNFALGAATAAASAVVLGAGFAASRAINEQIDRENQALPTIEPLSTKDLAEDSSPFETDIQGAPDTTTVNNITTINNITNTENTVNNLGTHINADRFIREAVRPTLQEISAERGEVGVTFL